MLADTPFQNFWRKLFTPSSVQSTEKPIPVATPQSSVQPGEREPAAYNLSLLESLVGSNTPALREIVEKFIRDTPQEITKLEQAFAQYDLSKLASQAHKLKSNLKLFGLDQILEDLHTLEEMGKGRIPAVDKITIQPYINRITLTLNRAIGELSNKFPSS